MPIPNIKTVYSLRVKNLLTILGFDYLQEVDNPQKEGFKCWIYEASPAFNEAFDAILKGGPVCNEDRS